MPCTTLLVGKRASYDGSTIIARNEDSSSKEFTPKRFVVIQPADQPRHYRSVLAHLDIDLPDDPQRYTCMPNALAGEGVWGEAGVNESDVAMSATETLTTNERVLGADPLVELRPAVGVEGEPGYVAERPGGISEEDLLTIVLPYIHSAREGVERLGRLLERYGTYEMNGVAFSDADEIWWLETVGGHHWIAKRVPDDAYVTMPNQLGIDSFDLIDAEGPQTDHMASADLREWMTANHLDLTLGTAAGDVADVFNPREAFGSHDDADHIYNTPRAWAMQRFLNPHACDWDATRAGDAAGNLGPESDDIPWCRVPERKVTIEDVKYALSLRYQGTPYDPYGIHGPSDQRGRYRPIGISRNSELACIQLRPYAPTGARAVEWVAFGSNAFNALVPFFANVQTTPAYLATTGKHASTDSFYWANRLVGALADAHYHACVSDIERYQLKVGSEGHALIAETDRELAAIAGTAGEGGSSEQAAPADEGAGAAAGEGTADPDKLAAGEVSARLAACNDRIAAMLRRETDDLLDRVLLQASFGMKNGFARSDG